jgi:predicted SAM-dependent methyltransferase
MTAADLETTVVDARRLHIGGEAPKDGWQILNVRPNEHTDYVGNVTDLSMFENEAWDEIYGSHILEHLDYSQELPAVLAELQRILKPEGVLRISVPDLEILSKLLVHPELNLQQRFHVMRMMFGGQTNPYDYHKVGFTLDFMRVFLKNAGFRTCERITSHGLFDDTSDFTPYGVRISLNVIARK